MAEKVTYKNLFSESWNNVKELVKTKVSDPISSSSQSRKWIYSRIPDVKNEQFKGYPFIVIYPVSINVGGELNSLNGKSKSVSWDVEVEIFSSDRGYKEGNGALYSDSISNQIMEVFLDKTNRDSLMANSMFFSRPNTTSVTQDVIENELIYRRLILLPFRSKIQVSI
jgi:hypothetical protein